jgi:hypothetical protein
MSGVYGRHDPADVRRREGRKVGAGQGFGFGPEHVHRLDGAVPGPVSVSYADELRPLD